MCHGCDVEWMCFGHGQCVPEVFQKKLASMITAYVQLYASPTIALAYFTGSKYDIV